MGRRFAFDVKAAIVAACDMIWADKQKQLAKGDSYRDSAYYLTAADVEYQVRQFAEETAKGEAWGTHGIAFGRPWGRVRLSGNLQGAVRDYLLYSGKFDSHNFGKSHISGARYRPRGAPLSPAEKTTMEKKTNAKPYEERRSHFSKGGYSGRPACSKPSRGWRPSKAKTTLDWTKVTCPRCLKLKATLTCN